MTTINISDFKPCKSESPEVEGDYLVVRFFDNKICYACCVHYTTEYGWNTGRTSDGEWNTKHVIDFEDDTFWAEVTSEVDNDKC